MSASAGVASASVYHDLAGLGALRSQASSTPSEAIEEVAGQFESLFVQMMLKSMRDASIEGGLFDSNQMEMYQSMFDQQISLDLSRGNALGLADVLVNELGGSSAPREQPNLLALASSAYRQANSQVEKIAAQAQSSPPAKVQSAAVLTEGEQQADVPAQAQRWSPASPEAFIRDVWDHAVDAAKQLGLDPLVLVAQSALETGWGKRVIQAVDGGSSFNLFGIKAGLAWEGQSAAVNSLEYRDGTAALEKSSFRVYDSIAKSFEDYVAFLKSNPRYQQALDKVGDAGEFLTELQDAGYATDPSYATKIMGIVGKTSFDAVVNELKKF
jgi:flagellar protein FlgJ